MDIVQLTSATSVADFTCGDDELDQDLDDFLRNDAPKFAETCLSQTYVAIENSAVVGYITLLVDAIWLTPAEKNHFEHETSIPPTQTIPALKVGRLARHAAWKGQGIGTLLMRHAYDKILDLSDRAGCRLLSVDAYPKSVDFYKKLGFVCNLHTNHTGKKRSTVSMRFDAFASTLPAWVWYAPQNGHSTEPSMGQQAPTVDDYGQPKRAADLAPTTEPDKKSDQPD